MAGYSDMRSRILSAPLQIHWAGWNTDSHRLQQNGWQLSADQNVMNNTMRIAIHHPEGNIVGMTEVSEFDYQRYVCDELHHKPFPIDVGMRIRHSICEKVHVQGMNGGFPHFNPIDATPRMMDMEVRELKDLAHFQEVQVAKNEVFLKEASMDQILEMALNKQEPSQAEIRKRIIKEQEMRRYGLLHTELRLVA